MVEYYVSSASEAIKSLNSSENGLTENEAEQNPKNIQTIT